MIVVAWVSVYNIPFHHNQTRAHNGPRLGVVEHGGHGGGGFGLDGHVHEPKVLLVQAGEEVLEAADVAEVDLLFCVMIHAFVVVVGGRFEHVSIGEAGTNVREGGKSTEHFNQTQGDVPAPPGRSAASCKG